MLAKDDYIASDAEIVRDSRRALLLCEPSSRSSVAQPGERRLILAELLRHIGERVKIRPSSTATRATASPSATASS